MSNKSNFVLSPIVGLFAYIILYYFGAIKYTGGSANIPNSVGYSFYHNLLCDLMLPIGINGHFNEGRNLGIISHIVLGITMIIFFSILPTIFEKQSRNSKLTKYLGMTSMIIFTFMFTSFHDLIVVLTAVVGICALIPFFLELKNYEGKRLKIYAYFCIVMSIMVFLSFITKIGYYYLPILQKITFAVDAMWVIWVCLIIKSKTRRAIG